MKENRPKKWRPEVNVRPDLGPGLVMQVIFYDADRTLWACPFYLDSAEQFEKEALVYLNAVKNPRFLQLYREILDVFDGHDVINPQLVALGYFLYANDGIIEETVRAIKEVQDRATKKETTDD